MIKRIVNIRQVGLYANISLNSYEFNKLTFIYGLNSYGKSTLCDIFKSLSKNDPSLIENRKTIPSGSLAPHVTLSVSDFQNPPKEKRLEYKNSKWERNEISNMIEIFDTKFIYDNIFTGLSIERNNKENFTEFNPDAHIFTTHNDEDVRAFLITFLEKIFQIKIES